MCTTTRYFRIFLSNYKESGVSHKLEAPKEAGSGTTLYSLDLFLNTILNYCRICTVQLVAIYIVDYIPSYYATSPHRMKSPPVVLDAI